MSVEKRIYQVRGGGYKLLMAYFFMSISYAHLPLAIVHHSLGSLFNYLVPPILAYYFFISKRDVSFSEGEIKFASFTIFIVCLTWLLQFYYVNLSLGMDGNIRSLKSTLSLIVSYFGLTVILSLARKNDFTFSDMSAAVFIAAIVLSVYLIIETIGIRFSVEPFSSIVDMVSKYLNYRDEARQSGGRIRGFTNEPSYLAVVVIFITSILLVDKTRSRTVNYLIVFILAAISSAAVSKNLVIGIALILIVHAFYFKRIMPWVMVLIIALVMHFIYSVSQIEAIQWQYDAYDVDFSTITRVGSWVAAFNGFLEAPLIGNGLGLAGGLIAKFYPDWFYLSPEAFDWIDASNVFAAPVFSYFFRILFEMGLLGVVYLAGLFTFLIRVSNGRSLFSHDNFLLMAGLFVSFLMLDSMSFWPFYVALGVKRMPSEVR